VIGHDCVLCTIYKIGKVRLTADAWMMGDDLKSMSKMLVQTYRKN
jgi:hypothetical protein